MTGRDYMETIRKTRRLIRLLNEQIELDYQIATECTGIRYDKDKVQTSPTGDRMATTFARIDENVARLNAEVDRLHSLLDDANILFINLKEEHERVLTLYYVHDVSLLEVAERMGYSERYIFELRNTALKELDSLLEA